MFALRASLNPELSDISFRLCKHCRRLCDVTSRQLEVKRTSTDRITNWCRHFVSLKRQSADDRSKTMCKFRTDNITTRPTPLKTGSMYRLQNEATRSQDN